ncbi:hypothetical protein QQ045_024318 [Rhodiola kirilowii]
MGGQRNEAKGWEQDEAIQWSVGTVRVDRHGVCKFTYSIRRTHPCEARARARLFRVFGNSQLKEVLPNMTVLHALLWAGIRPSSFGDQVP